MTTKAYPKERHGRPRTPWAVVCEGPWDVPNCGHGLVYLTRGEYNAQMDAPNKTWRCPICRYSAAWDDENYEQMMEMEEEAQ